MNNQELRDECARMVGAMPEAGLQETLDELRALLEFYQEDETLPDPPKPVVQTHIGYVIREVGADE